MLSALASSWEKVPDCFWVFAFFKFFKLHSNCQKLGVRWTPGTGKGNRKAYPRPRGRATHAPVQCEMTADR